MENSPICVRVIDSIEAGKRLSEAKYSPLQIVNKGQLRMPCHSLTAARRDKMGK